MIEPIRVLVVDDEPHARAGLRKLLERQPGFVQIGEAADGEETVRAIRELAPDLVLLDVQMPGMDGFEVLEELSDETLPMVVFVTAFDQFAVNAFAVSALDYLVKPFSDARFVAALERAREQLQKQEYVEVGRRIVGLLSDVTESRHRPALTSATPSDTPSFLTRFVIKAAQRTVVIAAAEVDWIEAASYYARLHVGSASHLLRESLNSLEMRLDPSDFARAHRCAIVRLEAVAELRQLPDGRHVAVLRDHTEVPVSRVRLRAFIARLRELRSSVPQRDMDR